MVLYGAEARMRNPTSFLKQEYDDLVAQELDWRLRTLAGPSTPWCIVDGKRVLMFCSNNYLGLSNHPKLKEMPIGRSRPTAPALAPSAR